MCFTTPGLFTRIGEVKERRGGKNLKHPYIKAGTTPETLNTVGALACRFLLKLIVNNESEFE